MATPLCMNGDEQPAAVILGMVDTGNQLIMCAACFMGYVTQLYETVINAENDDDDEGTAGDREPVEPPPAPKTPAKRARAARKPTAAADTATDDKAVEREGALAGAVGSD